MLSAAAIATSFLGGQALVDGRLTLASWLAIAAFAALGGCVLRILLPQHDWEFTAIPRRIINTYIESQQPLSLAHLYRDLALHMEDSYEQNGYRIRNLVRFFRSATLLITIEVVAWIADIAWRG